MKKIIFFTLFFVLTTVSAQKKVELKSLKYSRSSLHTVLIETPKIPFKETVMEAYYNAPFPEKYNNHQLEEKSFDPRKYVITNQDRINAGLKERRSDAVMDTLKLRKEEIPLQINKYFKEEKIGNKLVAKWFNRQEDGSFNMDLVAERGLYNASEMEMQIANGKALGTALIEDAGEQLLNNTFVVVSQSAFLENEVVADAIRTSAYVAAELLGGYKTTVAKIAADVVYKATKDGYSIFTDALLYKLRWNDSIAAVFYNQHWMDKSNLDEDRKMDFENSDIFTFDYIGIEKSRTVVTAWNNESGKKKFKLKLGSKRDKKDKSQDDIVNTKEEYIAMATVRNLDKVIVELQKRHDIFKTKTPIVSVDPITAKVGTKEGLNGGERFEVFEQYLDIDTGRTKYDKIGVIKVDKKGIWDNQYTNSDDQTSEESGIEATIFKNAGGKILPGMLIRQIK